jgi:hypothetical protein
MDSKNITDRIVTIDKTNGVIIVQFPWKSDETDFDPQKAVSELGETAKLTFRDPDGNVVWTAPMFPKLCRGRTCPPVRSFRDSRLSFWKLTNDGSAKFAEATRRPERAEDLDLYG